MKTWRQMEALVDRGLVRHIGTSNMTIPKLELVLRDARIKPACNEMELHPHFQQPELFRYVRRPRDRADRLQPDRLAQPARARPDRDRHRRHRRPGDRPDRRAAGRPSRARVREVGRPARAGADPVLGQAAAVPEQPEGGRRRAADRRRTCGEIAAIDKNCRLIKGQVFLWKDGQTWEDLWDVNGEITPP